MQKNDQAYLLYSIETTVSRVGFGLRRHLRFQFFFFFTFKTHPVTLSRRALLLLYVIVTAHLFI